MGILFVYNTKLKGVSTILFFFSVMAGSFAQTVKLDWVNAMPGNSYDVCRAIVLDDDNNVYATGFYSTTVDFDPGPGIANLSSVNAEDIFLAKYAPDGSLVWAKSIGDFRYQAANAIALDSARNIYITGIFFGTTDFDPGPGVANLVSNGNEDIFVCKYDRFGNFIWARSFGGPTNEFCNSIKLDKAGNIYFNGYFENVADFDPGPGTYNLTSTGAADIFICKISPFGNLIWARSIGGPLADAAFSIGLDEQNNVYSTGFFWSTADFDPGPGTFNLTSPASGDGFILKLDANGNFIKAGRMGGSSRVRCISLKLDETGHMYVTGQFDGDAEFDINGGGAVISSAIDDEDLFIAKYDLDFNLAWVKHITGSSYQKVFALETDANQDIYFTGHYHGTVDFDPGPGELLLTAEGDPDIFVVKFNKDGELSWLAKATGPFYGSGYALQVDKENNVIVGGTFEGTIDFDSGPDEYKLSSAGESEIFLKKLRQCPDAAQQQIMNVNACSAFTLHNKTFDSSGVYTVNLLNAAGCDSIIITLNLTINRLSHTVDANICQGDYYLAAGGLQSRSGIYYDTLTTQAGCDSVIITRLTVWEKPKPNLGKDRNICAGETIMLTPGVFDSYLWQDSSTAPQFTVSMPGTYQVTVSNQFNCKGTDRLVIREVAPKPAGFLPGNQNLCSGNVLKLQVPGFKSYTWNDGSTSPSLDIRIGGTYFLAVTSFDNCTGTDTISINEVNCIPIGIPNAFTPNNDGNNDLFRPTINTEITSYELQVFNRSGRLIYRTTTYGEGWDGRFKGQPADAGNYIYRVSFRDAAGKPFYRTGNVLLIK